MRHTLGLLVLTAACGVATAEETNLSQQLRKLNGRVFSEADAQQLQLARTASRDARVRLQAANRRESEAWQAVKTRADWEHFRDTRLQALRASLGQFPAVSTDLHMQVSGKHDGDGYRVENLVFKSRPGLLVTANLYVPAQPLASMPGILIIHSHHNPKTQGELQDMGMNWARLGCLVLVPDQLGHGERRQHPFVNAASYAGSFRPDRQDYYFRYITGMQLHLAGESQIGWMAWDMMRCVDLLLSRPGIDPKRIILLGAVAGGGDPAAVTAALDPRISAVVPFNFGGPQPETVYPLPADAEQSFNYAGGGSWESTRNLRLSARDGFLPWVIVGAAAPRPLIYAHEFSWDQERDPAWKRLQAIYQLYGVPDHIGETHGRGKVTGKPPESTHCNNIGAEHRRSIYPYFQRWFGMKPPEEEYRQRRPAEELLCMTDDMRRGSKPVHRLAAELAAERLALARKQRASLTPAESRQQLRRDWAKLLGDVNPEAPAKVLRSDAQSLGSITVERLALEAGKDLTVPVILLLPPHAADARLPVVVACAQEGKQTFLEQRSEVLARLLEGGAAVCLPDLRGTGETRPDGSRGRQTSATSVSATEQMLGQTMLGRRLRDLRAVLAYLRQRRDVDASRLALWGDSFAPTNAKDRNLAVPLDADRQPAQAEPLGGLLALFGSLFEDDIRAASIRGGLVSFASVLDEPFCYVPHDALVPGALTVSDLADVAAALAPQRLCLADCVEGQNRRVSVETLRDTWKLAPVQRLTIFGEPYGPTEQANWLLAQWSK